MIFIKNEIKGQLLWVTKTDTFSTTSTSWVDVPSLSITVTPTSSSSKFRITAVLTGGSNEHAYARVLRNSVPIGVGNAAGSRQQVSSTNFYEYYTGIRSSSFVWIDSPNTASAITYKVQVVVTVSGYAMHLGKSGYDDDTSYRVRTAQYFEVQEIL